MRQFAKTWMNDHKPGIIGVTFALMILSAGLCFPAANHQATGWIWILLGVFITCNLIILIIL
jgi:hypothetical protein